MSTPVGVIGLGVMGRPMARRLLAAGHPVIVHNRSRPAVDALVAAGAQAARSPAEVARGAAIVLTALPDPDAVEAVVLGPDGVREGAARGGLLVDVSTSAPALARRIHSALAEQGVDALDAPVSGGERGAHGGTLTVMVGGGADAVARAWPVLDVLAARITHVGGPGAGQIAKAANQVIVALNIQAVAEALALARAAGVDPARVREAIRGGFAESTVLDQHGDRMLRGDFRPGAALRLHAKDLRLAAELAADAGIELPATAAVRDAVAALIADGHGEEDHAVLVARYAGVSI